MITRKDVEWYQRTDYRAPTWQKDPEKLAFELETLITRIADHIVDTERMHQENVAALRGHMDAGVFLLGELRDAQRQGRKTIRIDTLLEEAERRYAAMTNTTTPKETPNA